MPAVGHILWFFDNTFASAATQQNIGPFNPGTVDRIFKVAVRGQISFQSSAVANPYVTANDILWGVQWVAHSGSPQNIQTSAPGDQWFWRNNVANRTDTLHVFAPSSATGVSQAVNSLEQDYCSQGNRPGANIDVYVSVIANFGISVAPILLLGSIDFFYD